MPVPGAAAAGTSDAAAADRAAEVCEALAHAVQRLDEAGPGLPDLLRLIPELICALGFDRATISRVEGDRWIPEVVHVAGDPQWSDELTALGRANPEPLLPGRFEYDVVTTGRAVLARDVDVEAWRALAKLARLTGCRSYVAAPIVSGGAVVGILHGERSGSPRDVDELDRRMLLTFSKSVQLALGRAGLSAELHNVYADLKTATRTVDRAVARDRRLPELRVESDVVPAAAPGVAHGGAAQGIAARLPLDLTDRELEVLGLVATGMTNAVIARRLGIAVSTVKQHLKNILRKLEVGSRAEAVAYWYAGPVPST